MEVEKLRIRLVFSNGVLTKLQKKDGLKRSWLLLKPQFDTISDFVSFILHSFDLYHSCPHGIILSMDGFVLPEFESTSILKDKDLISVKRKETRLLDANKSIKEAETYIEDERVEREPLASDVRLLANEEFDRETEGCQSEADKDEDEAIKSRTPVPNAPNGDLASKKRKASSKLQSSKKKRKLQAIINTAQEKHLHDCEHITKPMKKSKHKNRSDQNGLSSRDATAKCANDLEPDCEHITKPTKKSKHKNRSDQNGLSSCDATVKCANDLNPESNTKSELDENREDTIQTSAIPDRAKKVSRSTLRRKSRKLMKKLNRDKAKRDEQCDRQQPVTDVTTDTGSKKDMVANIIQQDDEEDSDAEGDLVPVVIRPGLIRFTPSGKVKDVQENLEANTLDVHSTQNGTWEEHSAPKNVLDAKHNQVAKEAYCWNGITNKRKGQKWGQETQPTCVWKESRNVNTHSASTWDCKTQSTSSWKDSRVVNGHCSSSWTAKNHSTSSWNESQDISGQSNNTCADKKHHSNNKSVDFDKLIPLIDLPKAGDIIAYRLLELSSSWCPEMSSFRVGKITSFEPDSNMIILVPVPEYPINLEKYDDGDEHPLGSSVYNEDGSLETEFPSLNDVRIMKLNDSTQTEGASIPAANGISSPSTSKKDDGAQGAKKATSDVSNQELHAPGPVNGKKDVWEEITEAVSEKKAKLMHEDNWNKKDTPAKRPWSYRSLRSSAIGPTMARLRAQNGA